MLRRSLFASLGLALLCGVAVLAIEQREARAATASVSVSSDPNPAIGGTFSPKTITIAAGDSVLWTWNGANAHSVTADDGSFDEPPSPGAKNSGTFSRTFNTPGTYAYYCRIHGGPGGGGMSGTIIVQAAVPTDTPAATNTIAASTSTPAATNTVAPTSTPGSVTPTWTPAVASGTPLASATPGESTPAIALTPSAPTATRSAGVAGAQLPRTGSGGGTAARAPWLSVAVALGALGVIAGAARLRRAG